MVFIPPYGQGKSSTRFPRGSNTILKIRFKVNNGVVTFFYIIYNSSMYINKKLSVIAIFCLIISGTFLFAESDSYYINKAMSDTKVGKQLSGPYESLDQAVAAWIATNMREDSFYCISKDKKVIATKPSKQISDIYNVVFDEFINDMDGAAAKYDVTLEPAAIKKLNRTIAKAEKTAKEPKAVKEKTPEEPKAPKEKKNKKTKTDVNETMESDESTESAESESEALEKTETSEIIEEENQIPEGPAPEELEAERLEAERLAKIEAEKKAKLEAERLAAEEAERKQKEKEAAEKAKQDEALKKALENVNKSQAINRYKKEYLQDYMKDEIAELPDNYETADTPLISNPNERDSNGQTLLMKAAKAGNEWQLKLLIDSGADINLKDKDGWTALMYAVRYQESLSAVNLLVNANAEIKDTNKYDSSALLLAACYNNNPEILKKLLNYYSISEKDVLKAFTQLLSSTLIPEYVQLAKINIFLEKGIQLNTFYEGKTPLMYAAQHGTSTKVLKLLLDNGCITTVRSTEGKTAFEYASKNTKLKHDDYYWALNKK